MSNDEGRTTRQQKVKKDDKIPKTPGKLTSNASKVTTASMAGGEDTLAGDASTTTRSVEDMLAAIERSNREVRTEIQQMREEVKAFKSENTETLTRLETSVGARLTRIEQRVDGTEERISTADDRAATHCRAISYLLQQEAEILERCEYLQNQERRRNLRLYQIPEASEKDDMVGYIKKLLPTVLPSLHMREEDIRIERAHRALAPKPKRGEPPRSIIVAFADYATKEAIRREAWDNGPVKMDGDTTIYFDNDYSPMLQRKRTQVRWVIKDLKKKKITAKCLFPARLQMTVESGEQKTFETLYDAIPTLNKMGIQVKVDSRDQLQSELAKHRWERQGNNRKRYASCLSVEDCQVFFPDKEKEPE